MGAHPFAGDVFSLSLSLFLSLSLSFSLSLSLSLSLHSHHAHAVTVRRATTSVGSVRKLQTPNMAVRFAITVCSRHYTSKCLLLWTEVVESAALFGNR